jgi:hypothetical protein
MTHKQISGILDKLKPAREIVRYAFKALVNVDSMTYTEYVSEFQINLIGFNVSEDG